MPRVPIIEKAQGVVCAGAQEVFRVEPVTRVDQFWLDQVVHVHGRAAVCDACGKFIAAGDGIRLVWIRDRGTAWANKRCRYVHAGCLRGGS